MRVSRLVSWFHGLPQGFRPSSEWPKLCILVAVVKFVAGQPFGGFCFGLGQSISLSKTVSGGNCHPKVSSFAVHYLDVSKIR